jgi:hypothetical protein
MSVETIARVLYDHVNSRFLKYVQDGTESLLGTAAKLRNVAGTIVNPATEDTLSTRATQTTVAALETILTAIRDTAGIKKITDQLPAGTNEIGKVAQGTKAAGSGAWPQVLYDASGNAVSVVLNNSIYRLESRSAITSPDGVDDVAVQTIDGVKHLAAGKANIIDSTNSSVAQLNPAGVFAPAGGTDVSQFASVAITLHSDQDSALDGMTFEFSQDGTNWDDKYKFNLDADTSKTRRFQFPVCARYFRVNYTNGATLTTEFRVQTILQRNNILTSIHRVQDVVKEDRSAQIMKSVIIAQREGAAVQDFYPVRSDVSGNLKVTTVGSDIPSDPAAFILKYAVNGTSPSMLVDGSVTPVDFDIGPTVSNEIWSIRELLLIFTADDFSFDGLSFGPNAAMTNGFLISIIKDSVTTEVFVVKQNEDFLRVPGRTPLVNNTGPKDVLGAALSFQGLVLNQADGDVLRVRVRDNLTSVKLKYLTATLFAVKVI